MPGKSRRGRAPHLTALVQGGGAPGRRLALVVGAAAIALSVSPVAFGQTAVTLNGPPVQVVPYVSEPGVPTITINPGTPNPFPAGDGGAASGEPGDDGAGGGYVAGSDPLNTMMGTTWGMTAIANAQSVGVNPSALAATCVLESGCQNISGSGAQGAFQMFPAAFQEGLQTALAANPALASQIVQGDSGRMDPTTEAIAASGYLIQGAQTLQNAGVPNPTVLDVRSYFNFGPTAGTAVAQASSGDLMSAYLSPAAMSGNNIRAGETVGEWRASVVNKIGNAADQSPFSI
jgi:hypothetical protein